jgi:carotenoid cleavage dioxygenase-like enzyme
MTSSRQWPFGRESFDRRHWSFRHLFDAIPMLERFELTKDGEVFYSSRRLGRRVIEAWESAKGKAPKSTEIAQLLYTSVGWSKGSIWHASVRIPRSQAAVIGTSVVPNFPMGQYHGTEGRLVLHQEGIPFCLEADTQSATTKGDIFAYSDLNGAFLGNPCPKPLKDPVTGELINVLVEYGKGPYADYRVVSITGDENGHMQIGRVIAKFKAKPTTVRSFGLTTDHVIIPIFPLAFHAKAQPSVFREGTKIEGFYDRLFFDQHDDTLFYVISRNQRCLIAVYRSEAAFAFNVVNAFESTNGSDLYLDVCAYRDDRILGALEMGNLRSHSGQLPVPTLRRYHLEHLKEEAALFYGAAGQMTIFPTAPYHSLSRSPFEGPVINSAVVGREHQFVYGLGIRRLDQERTGVFWNAVLKQCPLYPFEEIEWSQPGCFPSPPTFIPSPEAIQEDDGCIITQILDVLRKRSFLLVLDAKDLSELDKFWLPVSVSPSFLEGCWLQAILGPKGPDPAELKKIHS